MAPTVSWLLSKHLMYIYLILTTVPLFTDKATKPQQGCVTCPRPHSQQAAGRTAARQQGPSTCLAAAGWPLPPEDCSPDCSSSGLPDFLCEPSGHLAVLSTTVNLSVSVISSQGAQIGSARSLLPSSTQHPAQWGGNEELCL